MGYRVTDKRGERDNGEEREKMYNRQDRFSWFFLKKQYKRAMHEFTT
jgi:hypothetical protein